MEKRLYTVLLLGTIALAWLAVAETRQETPSAKPAVRSESADSSSIRDSAAALNNIRQELTAVQRQMASLQNALTTLSAQQTASLGYRDLNTGAASADKAYRQNAKNIEAVPKDSIRQLEARLEAIETGFRGESTDTDWANRVDELVRQSMTSSGIAQNRVQMLECRSTVCRMEIFHPTPAARSEFQTLFPLMIGGELPEMTVQPVEGPDGTSISRIYLARSGHDLATGEVDGSAP